MSSSASLAARKTSPKRCLEKRRYRALLEAARAGALLERFHGKPPLTAYACPTCGFFHLTSV